MEKIIILKSLSLPLEDIRIVLEKLSYKQILISHYNFLQEQFLALQSNISKTASLINMIDLDQSISWERVSKLVQNSNTNARKWTDYFEEEEKAILQNNMPNFSNNDGVTQQYILLLQQIELCIQRHIKPESDEGAQIAAALIELSNDHFQGDANLMEKFWEIRKLPAEETGLFPISEDVLEFVERCIVYVDKLN